MKDIQSERAYFLDRIEQDASFFFMIIDQVANELIGAIEIRAPGYRSQLYCWINERWWGTGHFSEAMKEAAEIYFLSTNKATITARVDYTNARSYRGP